ncbi:MAG: XisI protein [Cyanobacteria bacterium P01_F01_bin.150]
MDKLEQYLQIIRQVLTEQAHPYTYSDKVETAIICDAEHDHYQLTYVGWEGQKRILSMILYFQIKNSKIWVQYNGTELAIAQIFIKKGVPASDIVLGFHTPFKRQFTDYAVG